MSDHAFIITAPDGWSELWEPTGETLDGDIPVYECTQRIEPLIDHPVWTRPIDWDKELAKLNPASENP